MATSHAKAVARVEKRIVDISEATPYLNILVYGRNKQGKTVFGASAPKPLIIDINEKGTRSASRVKGAKVFPAATWADVVHAYWYLKEADHGFESVVIDTATAMQQVCMRRVLGEAEDRDPNREPDMPDRRVWGKVAELMRPQILAFRNLPLHVIFTAQERQIGDPDEGEDIERVPDLSPGSRGPLLGAVDIIGRVYMRENKTTNKKTGKTVSKWEPRMLLGPHDEYVTGKRETPEFERLPRIMRNPTVPKILAALNEKE